MPAAAAETTTDDIFFSPAFWLLFNLFQDIWLEDVLRKSFFRRAGMVIPGKQKMFGFSKKKGEIQPLSRFKGKLALGKGMKRGVVPE